MKWPNDIYLDGKKVAGILVESEPATGLAVIGIGLNVNGDPTSLGDELAAPATSLGAETGAVVDRSVLAVDLLRELQHHINRATADFPGVLDGLRQLSSLIGRAVTLTLPDGQSLSGTAKALGSEGELVLELADGSTRQIASASQVRTAA